MPDAFALGGLRGALVAGGTAADEEELARRRTPESFLGPNSNLVNLDALVTTRSPGEPSCTQVLLEGSCRFPYKWPGWWPMAKGLILYLY